MAARDGADELMHTLLWKVLGILPASPPRKTTGNVLEPFPGFDYIEDDGSQSDESDDEVMENTSNGKDGDDTPAVGEAQVEDMELDESNNGDQVE
jgi:hypothetical protein